MMSIRAGRPRTTRRLGAGAALLAFVVAGCGGAATVASSDTIAVTSSATACTVSRTTLPAGKHVFAIENTGSQPTEVYVYAPGDKIVAEKENIGPALKVQLEAELAAGSYDVTCKPGQTGAGIRTPITVTG